MRAGYSTDERCRSMGLDGRRLREAYLCHERELSYTECMSLSLYCVFYFVECCGDCIEGYGISSKRLAFPRRWEQGKADVLNNCSLHCSCSGRRRLCIDQERPRDPRLKRPPGVRLERDRRLPGTRLEGFGFGNAPLFDLFSVRKACITLSKCTRSARSSSALRRPL